MLPISDRHSAFDVSKKCKQAGWGGDFGFASDDGATSLLIVPVAGLTSPLRSKVVTTAAAHRAVIVNRRDRAFSCERMINT